MWTCTGDRRGLVVNHYHIILTARRVAMIVRDGPFYCRGTYRKLRTVYCRRACKVIDNGGYCTIVPGGSRVQTAAGYGIMTLTGIRIVRASRYCTGDRRGLVVNHYHIILTARRVAMIVRDGPFYCRGTYRKLRTVYCRRACKVIDNGGYCTIVPGGSRVQTAAGYGIMTLTGIRIIRGSRHCASDHRVDIIYYGYYLYTGFCIATAIGHRPDDGRVARGENSRRIIDY